MTINEQTLQELAKQFGLALDWSNKNIIPYLHNWSIFYFNWYYYYSFKCS